MSRRFRLQKDTHATPAFLNAMPVPANLEAPQPPGFQDPPPPLAPAGEPTRVIYAAMLTTRERYRSAVEAGWCVDA